MVHSRRAKPHYQQHIAREVRVVDNEVRFTLLTLLLKTKIVGRRKYGKTAFKSLSWGNKGKMKSRSLTPEEGEFTGVTRRLKMGH